MEGKSEEYRSEDVEKLMWMSKKAEKVENEIN